MSSVMIDTLKMSIMKTFGECTLKNYLCAIRAKLWMTAGKRRRNKVARGGEAWLQSGDDIWSQVCIMTSEGERSCICMAQEILFPQKVSS